VKSSLFIDGLVVSLLSLFPLVIFSIDTIKWLRHASCCRSVLSWL